MKASADTIEELYRKNYGVPSPETELPRALLNFVKRSLP